MRTALIALALLGCGPPPASWRSEGPMQLSTALSVGDDRAESRDVRLPLVLTIGGDGPEPRDVRLIVRAPDGSTSDESCAFSPSVRACPTTTDWYRGPGRYEVTVRARAIDDLVEELALETTIHGDEVMLHVHAYAAADASFDRLEADFVRGVPSARIVGGTSGELPRLVNDGRDALQLRTRGGALHWSFYRVEPSSLWSAAFFGPPRIMCGTGLVVPATEGSVAVEPGGSIEVDAIGERASLPLGRFVRAVWIETPGGRRAVIEPVTGTFGGETQWRGQRLEDLHDRFGTFPNVPAGVPVLARPGRERPPGLGGALERASAPLVRSGDTISGELSAATPRHLFRIEGVRGQVVAARIYVRCTSSPCAAHTASYFGRGESHGGWGARVRRTPPAWSTRDVAGSVYDDGDHFVEITCEDRCADGPTEFYGRIHVVTSGR